LDEAAAELVHCTTTRTNWHSISSRSWTGESRLTAGGTELELLQLLVDEPKFNVGVGQKPTGVAGSTR